MVLLHQLALWRSRFVGHLFPPPCSRHTSWVNLTWKRKLRLLNLEGVVALLPGVICLCLALQWGGFTYSVSVLSFHTIQSRNADNSKTVEQRTDRCLTYSLYCDLDCTLSWFKSWNPRRPRSHRIFSSNEEFSLALSWAARLVCTWQWLVSTVAETSYQ